jgi:hypothetical protein
MQIEAFCTQISSRGENECNFIVQVAKGLKEQMKIKEFKMVRCLKMLDIVSIPNGHIPLCNGHVMFELAHTYWWVNMFMCH